MKKEILKCISRTSPYSYEDVERVFNDLNSYDFLLVAINISLTQNINLADASGMIREAMLSKSTRKAYFEELDRIIKELDRSLPNASSLIKG